MLTSSLGLLELFRSEEPIFKEFALKKITTVCDEFWYELSDQIPEFEKYITTGETVPEEVRTLTALLISKIYYHMDRHECSADYALRATPAFNLYDKGHYTQTITRKIIERYIHLRQTSNEIPRPLETFCDNLFLMWKANVSTTRAHVSNMIGLALSSRRLDLLQVILGDYVRDTGKFDLLSSCVQNAFTYVRNLPFRRDVCRMVSKMFRTQLKHEEYMTLLRCLVEIDDSEATAKLLMYLTENDELRLKLTAVQLSFEMFERCRQEFILEVLQKIGQKNERKTSDQAPGYAQLHRILAGHATVALYIDFLSKKNVAADEVLAHAKHAIEGGSSVTQNGLVLCNAFMYCGTTMDGFLRNNLQWLAQCNDWTKFASTVSVGVIHKGNLRQVMQILQPYLPKVPPVSPHQEGGALFALGLASASLGINASITVNETEKHRRTVEYLAEAIKKFAESEPITHGAALGLGLVGLGTKNQEYADELFILLGRSEAVAGEGCAVAIGLIFLGSGDTTVALKLLAVAREKNQKEKVIRGCVMATAFVMYAREEESLTWAEQLLGDNDPWIRLGGCLTLSMAFVGTEDLDQIERLLHVGISDTSDDVRRTAFICVGFLTLKKPGNEFKTS